MDKEKLFMSAEEIVMITGMSEAYAYKLIKQLNNELKQQGFVTIRGRISRQYFEERIYGIKKGDVSYAGLQRQS